MTTLTNRLLRRLSRLSLHDLPRLTLRRFGLLLASSLAFVFVGATACGGASFDDGDDEDQNRDEQAQDGSCTAAKNSCESFLDSYCGSLDSCGLLNSDDCTAAFEGDGWDCDFASTTQGDVTGCIADVRSLTCDALASDNPIAGTRCEDASFSFSQEKCEGADRSADDETNGGGNVQCDCGSMIDIGCYATPGCVWTYTDSEDPTKGYCNGVYDC
jgi:hypothetical protein